MAISFDQVPAASRIPLVYVEIDGSRAAPDAPDAYRVLLVGGSLSTGSAARLDPTDGDPAGEVVPIYDVADAQRRFGRGSMLAAMAAAYRRQHPLGQIWGVGIDDSGGAAGTRTVTVTGTATAAGTIALYVGGHRVAVTVTSTQTAAQVATAIKDAIDDQPDLPVTAASAAGVVTLTMRHAGPAAVVDVRDSLHPDEAVPAGVALAHAAGTAGATDPTLTHLWTLLGDERYDLIVSPYTETAQMQSLETELRGRWDVSQQLGGVGITAYRGAGGTAAQATTYGSARNSPYVVVMDAGKSLSPDYEWAAAVAGQVARSAEIDPARPFQTLPLLGVTGPPRSGQRTYTERNGMLHDGIATHVVDAAGTVRIERLITTYQTAAGGIPDTAYLDLCTPLTLDYIRRDFRGYIGRKYPRHKLADDGVRISPGQAVITPRLGRAEAIARYRVWEARGLVEGAEAFRTQLVCERNASDRNRLDWLMTPDLVNQFRVGGAKIQFVL